MPTDAFDPVAILAERFRAAIAAAFPQAGPDVDPLISASRNPQFGDFQSNAAMGLGKGLGRPPREVAKEIMARLDLGDVAEPLTDASIAGPGFINIRLRQDSLAGLLGRMDAGELGLPRPEAPAGPGAPGSWDPPRSSRTTGNISPETISAVWTGMPWPGSTSCS